MSEPIQTPVAPVVQQPVAPPVAPPVEPVSPPQEPAAPPQRDPTKPRPRGRINEQGEMVLPEGFEKPVVPNTPPPTNQLPLDQFLTDPTKPPVETNVTPPVEPVTPPVEPVVEPTTPPVEPVTPPAEPTPNPFIRKVGEREFDTSKPEVLEEYEAALIEEGKKLASNEKDQTLFKQSAEESWNEYLAGDPFLKKLGVADKSDAAELGRQVASGEAPAIVERLFNTATVLHQQLEQARADFGEEDPRTQAALAAYNSAYVNHSAYRDATNYIERLAPVKQSNEMIAKTITEHNRALDGFWKSFAPLTKGQDGTAIPAEEWVKGDKSNNIRVRDVYREVMNNPAYWESYTQYGKQVHVLKNPNVIREEYEARYGKIPVVAKPTGVPAKPPVVHGASPQSTVVSPEVGSVLSDDKMIEAINDPTKFESLATDSDRDRTAMRHLLWKNGIKERTGSTPINSKARHVEAWIQDKGLRLKS